MKFRNWSLLVVFFFTMLVAAFDAKAQQRDSINQPNKTKMKKDTTGRYAPHHPADSVYRKQQRPNTQPIDTPPHSFLIAMNDQAQQPIQSQQPTQTQQPANTTFSETDKKVLLDLIGGNSDEIKMAQLAEQKSSNDKVKNVAKMLESDHSQMLDDLNKLASAKLVNVPKTDSSHEAMEEKMLVSNKPDAFDNAWIKAMLGDHTTTLNALESATNAVSDADLKNAIQKAIPIVKTHIEKLNQLKQQL
jgi:putative membrane protein